jgi:hypothetical protein
MEKLFLVNFTTTSVATDDTTDQGDETDRERPGDDEGIRVGRRSYLRVTALAGALLGAGIGFGSNGVSGLVQPAYAYTHDGTPIIRSTESVSVTTTETEPNDDRQSATSIEINRGVDGTLTVDEHDWFAIEADADEPLTVVFERVTGSATAAVAVYGTDGTFVDLLVEGTAPNELTTTPDAAGTMFVQVIDLDGGAGSYRLLVHDSSYQPPTPTSTPTDTPTPTPTADPGVDVWIQAESADGGADFAPLTVGTDDEASNGEYVHVPNGEGNHYGTAPDEGRAEYAFEVPTDGEYVIWGRCIAPTSDDNSFWVSVDDGREHEWWIARDGDGGRTEWGWFEVNDRVTSSYPVTFDLSAGEHTLTVTWREDGTKLDRLFVTDDLDAEPTGTGGTGGGTPTPTPTSTPAPSGPGQGPYDGSVRSIPGRIQAENYDVGGPDVSYSDTTERNMGGYRDGAVDVEPTDDEGGGYNLGWTDDGEWTEYTVDVEPGTYDVGLRVASFQGDGRIRVLLDDESLGEIDVPQTGGWQSWRTITVPGVTLESTGGSVLRVETVEGGYNLNWIEFVAGEPATPADTPTSTPDPTETPTPPATPTPQPNQSRFVDHDVSRIEAEAYDEGGEGVAYHDTDDRNDGDAYRSGGVDVESTTDDDGYNVGWIRDGEWLEYTVDLTAGTYDLRARVASIHDGTQLRAILDGEVLGTFDVPNTGGWQSWQTITLTGLDTDGGRVLRLEAINNGARYGFNVNWVGFAETDSPTPAPTSTPTSTPTPTATPTSEDATMSVSGELKQWHRVTLAFEGPATGERADPNPFLRYRLDVEFTGPSGREYVVPGFYATDGNGGESGDVWKARFAPDETGTWSYEASFREGTDVAVSLDPTAGSPTGFDGASGTFTVAPTDKSGRDFRAHGILANRGDHYLQFPDGARWLKCGPDVPENLLGYEGFTNQPNASHDYAAHRDDWESGDPDWNGGDGRGLIGALNYIASTGSNCVYFLPMNVGGDGNDTWPFIDQYGKTRYDADKLRQWETAFTHAQSKGVFLHFQLAETESGNENYFDGGDLGVERKLFYRELIARFGHHPGLQWNLGEENDFETSEHEQFAAYIHDVDPYDHPVTTHTRDGEEEMYDPLLGNEDIDVTSFQGDWDWTGDTLASVVRKWRQRSANAGVPWVVSLDEPFGVENDHDDRTRGLPYGRTSQMWPTFMSGGGGFEWYVMQDGGGHSLDQNIDDLRDIAPALEWSGHLLEFFERIPYWRMETAHDDVSGGDGYMLEEPGSTYAVYLPSGDEVSLDIAAGEYELTWFDPESGSETAGGTISGGDRTTLDRPPFGGDVAALLQE